MGSLAKKELHIMKEERPNPEDKATGRSWELLNIHYLICVSWSPLLLCTISSHEARIA